MANFFRLIQSFTHPGLIRELEHNAEPIHTCDKSIRMILLSQIVVLGGSHPFIISFSLLDKYDKIILPL